MEILVVDGQYNLFFLILNDAPEKIYRRKNINTVHGLYRIVDKYAIDGVSFFIFCIQCFGQKNTQAQYI